jgi:uncharacterized protein
MAGTSPVALVLHRRIRDEAYGRFAEWQARVGERLGAWPGFSGQEVVPPAPPLHVDWTVIQRFKDAEAAHGWLQSEDLARLLDEARWMFVGQEDLHLLPDGGPQPRSRASVMISYDVPHAEEPAFLKWQSRIQAAEAKFPGFVRHKIERPLRGVHDDWLIVINFDSDTHMTAWLESPERQALLEQGGRFGRDLRLHRTNYGFDFWFPGGGPTDRHRVFKNNLLILLVLYPIVVLWMRFAGGPLEARGVPFWLTLFAGNVVSTQLIGWWAAPAVFKRFDWWLGKSDRRRQIAGYALLGALYALSMAACAFLFTHAF